MNKQIKEQAVEALQGLAEAGKLSPEQVVTEASKAGSPLHDCFEWDDSVAGHKYRLSQARDLIRSVQVVITVHERTLYAPKYVHDPRAGKNAGYAELVSLKSDIDVARDVVRSELQRAFSALNRANKVAEVLGLNEDIGALISSVSRMSDHLDSDSEQDRA
jgi:hypothetical protein